MYCAAICSSLALLAGSDNIQAAMVSQWLEKAADCHKVREDVAWLIYFYLGDFFSWLFTVKKTSHPPPAEKLSCLYIQWFA